MPAKGTRKIPKKEKAQIIAEKRLKTATEVALTHGISPSTVYSIQYHASPEILAMAEEYHKHVTKQGQLNVLAGLQNMHSKMADPDTPLKELTPAVKVNHDIVQVQTGGPTSITETRIVDTKILDYFNSVSEEADLRGALEIVQEHCVEMLRLRGISVNQGDVDRWVEERRLALAKRVENNT